MNDMARHGMDSQGNACHGMDCMARHGIRFQLKFAPKFLYF
jgi:hypothetical protein